MTSSLRTTILPCLTSWKMQVCLALVFSLISILIASKDYTFENYTGDSHGYIKIADDLVKSGTFTDGHYSAQAVVQGPHGEGMFFAPLYPTFLAGVITVDPAFAGTVDCYLAAADETGRRACPQELGLLQPVQMILAILSLFLVWLSAWHLTGRLSVAWLSMILASCAEAYAYYTSFIMTEALVFPLFTAACLLAVLAWKYKKGSAFFACGVMLGLLALTRPSYIYLFYLAFAASVAAGLLSGRSLKQKLGWPLLLLAGYALMAAPWMIRNGQVLGTYAISKGYAPFILTQRIAYNEMDARQLAVSFVYGLPDFGDSLVKKYFPAEDYAKLDYSNPDGYYQTSNREMWKRTDEGIKVSDSELSNMIKTDVLGNLTKHVMVTFSLAWRGMWVSKYWGLIAIPVFMGVAVSAIRRKWSAFFVFSIPPWFMLGLHAFTSVNVVRYNLILIPCLAIAVAVAIMAGVDRLKTARRSTDTTLTDGA